MSAWNIEASLSVVVEKIGKHQEKCKLIFSPLEDNDVNNEWLEEYGLYIKDGEEISKMLALMGANSSVLKYEDIRVLKETKNNINRKVNCETANLKKTVSAAVSQIQAIEKLKKERRFKSLPENLREIAEVRIENPDATLAELGKMLSVPIR